MLGKKKTAPVVLAVSSSGGHWTQMQRLAPAFSGADLHYATTDETASDQVGKRNFHVFPDANKDTPVRLIWCALSLAWIVLRVRPDVIVSTGAAGGFIAIKIGRLLGARTMFIDSIANARRLSVSARLALNVADHVLSQWPGVAAKTGAEYRGAVI
jgi:exopolysaccharide biosynthesis glucuronosyltransferase PssD